MLFYKSGCRASARRAAEGRTRLCRDQSNAMLALSPKESTETVAAAVFGFVFPLRKRGQIPPHGAVSSVAVRVLVRAVYLPFGG